ncbi:MAG TPA: hypothetical protein VMJ70_04590 [Candidatus Sulfotelmatobacter sp.]|nr:hypothetical protein [Candidatus Sulfotelmatobacter sp.]
MTEQRVVTREHMRLEAAAARRAGERVTLVEGDFDLLSLAAARFLAGARAAGGRLLVAVSGDRASAARLGPGRPLLSAVERARLVAGLRGVDLVAIDDDPESGALARELNADLRLEAPVEVERATFERVLTARRAAE